MTTRPPAVAGAFYPGDAHVLASMVDRLLAQAAPPPRPAASKAPKAPKAPKALIVPHAGYIYSGSTAAAGYALLAAGAGSIRRVVLLGPTHRVAVAGMALPGVDAFATPLGRVPLDTALLAELARLPQVEINDAAHAEEHSLEVQLPFLQRRLGDFTLVPVAVGHAGADAVAALLEAAWGGPETLIVVSSDLSHFLPYAQAQVVDAATCQQILAGDLTLRPAQACGAFPLNGLLLAARRRGLQPTLIAHCNSGDTAGDRGRVVGYAAFAFDAPEVAHA